MKKYGVLMVSLGICSILFAYAHQVYTGENSCTFHFSTTETKAHCTPPEKSIPHRFDKIEQAIGDMKEQAIRNNGTAIVFDPPSNVRSTPNGKIVCSISRKIAVNIYQKEGSWYKTDACGTTGYIHYSQINF